MTEKKTRYAVVGGGPFTREHVLPAFEHVQNAELCALVSGNEQKSRTLARRHGVDVSGGIDELELLLERSRADAIYLAAASSQHRALTERAARAGVHVLCDPPLADGVDDCQAMIESCRAAGVKLMLAYPLHFDEASADAIAAVKSGRIGAPRVFSSLLMRPRHDGARSKLSPGALWALALYPIHTARHLFGAEPIRVFASAARGDLSSADIDATLSAILVFEDERFAQLSVSLSASAVASFRLIGERGSLRVEPAYGCDTPQEYVLDIGHNSIERRFPHKSPLVTLLTALSRALQEDGEVEPDGREGMADVRVLEALLESRRSGRMIELPKTRASLQPGVLSRK